MPLKVSLNESLLLKPFAFTADCKDLEASIQKATATLESSPSGDRIYLLISTKQGKVYVAGLGSQSFGLLRIPNAVGESPGFLCFDHEKLSGIIKGRSVMHFSFTATQECEFKLVKGKYNGKILTLPITSETLNVFNSTFNFKPDKSETVADFSTQTLETLREGLNVTAVKDVFNSTKRLSYIEFKDKSVTVSTWDNHHFGYYNMDTDYVGSPFSIAVPISHFQLIDKIVSGYSDENVTFTMRSDLLRVDSNSFIAVLPLIQASEKDFNMVGNFLDNVGKADMIAKLNMNTLATIADNLFTLHTVNTTFDFNYKEATNQLKVTFTSPSGSASDQMKVDAGKSKSMSAKVDPKVFKDVMTLAKMLKEPTINIKADKCFIVKGTTTLGADTTLVCSLV